MRADLQRQMDAHVRTLDQLPTAVAIFDARQRLIFHNAAYRQLWDLDPAFLDGAPHATARSSTGCAPRRKLPEQADFRAWKAERARGLPGASRRSETWWYLPDGRTLRVVANPNPQGGLTYLFDDVTERIELESRYNALMRVQGETLDTLKEGVAVFGSDGRLKLHNRAFAELWRLDAPSARGRSRMSTRSSRSARPLAPDEDAVGRHPRRGRRPRRRARAASQLPHGASSTAPCSTAPPQPLPDGATLLTFIDVTASVNVERALTERNEALETRRRSCATTSCTTSPTSCARRSPTSSASPSCSATRRSAPLNERQREYAGHIMRSSGGAARHHQRHPRPRLDRRRRRSS